GWASLRSAPQGYTILEPLERKSFTRWGRRRMHLTLCGHAVHLSCWDSYFASLIDRSQPNQVCFFF
ncbi:unnamed protein product, partial [Choristocarpus tenellus]